jgi:HAD superfamily hydrolase (TIGR01549 family)
MLADMNAPTRAWPKAILFDLDDTLWPIAPVIARAEHALHAWLQRHAPDVARQFSIDQLRAARLALLARQPEFHLDLGALRRAGLELAFEQVGADRRQIEPAMRHFQAARNAVTPYPDVLPGLSRLQGQALIGSISNGVADLQVIGMAHLFAVSVAAHQIGCAKPAPAIFHAACDRLGVAPADALYVGDDLLLDVQGAQQAGLRAVWLKRGAGGVPASGAVGGSVSGAPVSGAVGGPVAPAASDVTPPAPVVQPDATCADFDELLDWLAREHLPRP